MTRSRPKTGILRQEGLTMDAAPVGTIICVWVRNTLGMPTFRIHATDYPEIKGEGRTHAEACDCLIQRLVQAIGFASEAWKCQPLERALARARASAPGVRTEPEPFASPLDLTRPGPPARYPAAGIIKEASSGTRP
jgi:hypothetical protein